MCVKRIWRWIHSVKLFLFCPILEVVNSCDRHVLRQTCSVTEIFMFLVITSSSIIGLEYPSGGTGGEIINYARREVPLPSQPSHLNVSCDQNYLVVAIKRDGCAHALIYNVPSFASKVSNVCCKCFVASVTWSVWNLYQNFQCEWNNEWMNKWTREWANMFWEQNYIGLCILWLSDHTEDWYGDWRIILILILILVLIELKWTVKEYVVMMVTGNKLAQERI